MHLSLATTLSIASLCAVASAQESYWVANRTSMDITQVDACGNALQTVPLGTSLRSAHVAPDGRIWIVRFIQTSFDVLNPDGTNFTTVTFGYGSPYDIAFDRAGHAWISGGTGVEEYDPNGRFVQQYPLTVGSPLGICVDADGNKWIAHRVGPPGFLSRIDGQTGNITTHSMGSASAIMPVKVYADFRGLGQSSHIWVVGDRGGAGELSELDAAGNVLNNYNILSSGNIGSVVADVDPATLAVRYVYVGDFRTGNLWQVDASNGAATQYVLGPDVLGLAIDGFQNVWTTCRGSTEVRRIDPATGTMEVAATVGAGVQSGLSTRWAHVTTVDPMGDLDNDGAPNFIEVQNLSSPFDPCSTPSVSLSVEGPTGIGTSTNLRVAGTGVTAVAFGTARVAAPITVPGIACTFQIDPPSLFPVSVNVPGGTNIPFAIPNNPGLVGILLFSQGVNLSGGAVAFSNLTCFKFY